MRNLKVIGKALLDVYENMFALLVINVIWALLAAIPVSMMLSVLQVMAEDPGGALSGPVILFLVSLLLVLLTGPVIYAMAVLMRAVTRYEAITVREFFATVRAHYRRGWLIGLVGAVGTFLLLVNLSFYLTIGSWGVVLVPLFLLLTILWAMALLYLYPMAVITEGGVLQVLRNTAIAVFRYPGLALLALLATGAIIALSTALLIPWVILTMVTVMAIGTRAVRSVVRRDLGLPEEDRSDDIPLPPIGGDEEQPLPHYGWRAHRQEAEDKEARRS